MKTIIEMAREAGLEEMWELTPRFIGRLEAFSEFVRADEREACAKVCEETLRNLGTEYYASIASHAIRAMGNT